MVTYIFIYSSSGGFCIESSDLCAKLCECDAFVFSAIRKEQLSAKFHRRHLLARCLRAWQKWVKTEQEEQQLREEHNRKTQKMAALLEAAASGRLWSERGGKMDVSLELKDIEEDGTEQSSSTARKLVGGMI